MGGSAFGAGSTFGLEFKEHAGFDLSKVEWEILTTGTGTVDLWNSDLPSAGEFPAGDNLRTVLFPATAKTIISVGSYATKASWTDATGTAQPARDRPSARSPRSAAADLRGRATGCR